MQQELDSVKQDLAENKDRLREVRAEMKDAKAPGNEQHLRELEQKEDKLLDLIKELQMKENRLSNQLGE